MKRWSLHACVILVTVLLGSTTAMAGSFSNTVDFSGSGTSKGHTYLSISDSSSYAYTQTVTFDDPILRITNADLYLTYSRVDGYYLGLGELWLVDGGNNELFLGYLGSTGNSWKTEHFDIPANLYNGVSGTTWSLKITFEENSCFSDSFWLDKSVLTGCYIAAPTPPVTSTPEPGTMLLLGTGMIGLLGARKRLAKG